MGSTSTANSHRFKPIAEKLIEKKYVFSGKGIVFYGCFNVESSPGGHVGRRYNAQNHCVVNAPGIGWQQPAVVYWAGKVALPFPNSSMKRLTDFIETQSFGLCSALGQRWGFSTRSVRLSFVYASFFTFGSPVVLYFAGVFWMNIRHAMRQQRSTVWDL